MEELAPAPDFRYVGFAPAPRLGPGYIASLFLGGAGVGVGLSRALSIAEAGAALAGVGIAFVWRKIHGPGPLLARGGAPLGFVPWGVLVEDDKAPRVLRWAAVRRVHLHVIYGRDNATPSTLWSLVSVETERERFTARAPGAVPLDRLLAYLEAYADEASHQVAMDLEGARAGEGPLEPDFEPLLESARAYVDTAPASSRLSLPPSSYRRAAARAADERTSAELRAILADRTPRAIDPRPFAAVLAAELHATDLVKELLALVQSPHPFVAAVAKVAATKLGADPKRAGSVDEVAPFLNEQDLAAMKAWAIA
jgi:hypothetical protein